MFLAEGMSKATVQFIPCLFSTFNVKRDMSVDIQAALVTNVFMTKF